MVTYAQFTISSLDGGMEYIVGTQTKATGAWTGVTEDARLLTGKSIAYKLPYAGSGNASLTLTLADGTTTPAIAVYFNTTRVTTHFGAGSVIQMTYDGTYWRATAIPNSNTYDRTLYSQAVKANTATYVGTHIICGTSAGYENIKAGASFDLSYPLLYYATGATTTIASGSTANNHYLDIPGVNFSINGTIESGAAYKNLYLKGSFDGSLFTIAESPFMTTVEPTSEDGYYYIPLGVMSNATSGRFVSSSDVYQYKIVGEDEDGNPVGVFGPLSMISQLDAALAQGAADQAQSSADFAQTAADRAQTSANNAQTAADQANANVSSLRDEISSNYVTVTDFNISNESIQTSVTEVRSIAESVQSSTEEKYNTLSDDLEGLEDRVATNESNISDVITATTNLTQTSTAISATVEEHTREIEELQGYTTGLKASMNLTAAGLDISGGDTSANTYVHINGDGVSITDGENTPAYFHGNESKMINVEVTEIFRIGNHKFLARSGGTNTTVVYVGD